MNTYETPSNSFCKRTNSNVGVKKSTFASQLITLKFLRIDVGRVPLI